MTNAVRSNSNQSISNQCTSTALMIGCLLGLIGLNFVQIAAGLSNIDIKPPENALPLIAATAALGMCAIPLVKVNSRLGYQIGIAFCLLSMIGAGPHKLFLENGIAIAPMALLGFLGEIVFIWLAVLKLRNT